jgi:uncharacterized protein YgiM (DUF1202 family)
VKKIITKLMIVTTLAVLTAASAQAQDDEYPLSAEVTSNIANVRTDSTVGAESICTVERKQRVEIIGQAYDWFKIKLPSQAPAYVSQQFVEVSAEENDRGVISGDNVNVRVKPELGGSILGQAQNGDKVRILGKSGNWYRIKPPESATGWVHKSMVGKPMTASAVKVKAKPEVKEQAPAVSSARKEEVQEIIVVEGTIKPKVMTSVATHKIVSAAREVFLLRSNTLDLKLFMNRPVRVTGMLMTSQRNLVEVQKVEETSAQESASPAVEPLATEKPPATEETTTPADHPDPSAL